MPGRECVVRLDSHHLVRVEKLGALVGVPGLDHLDLVGQIVDLEREARRRMLTGDAVARAVGGHDLQLALLTANTEEGRHLGRLGSAGELQRLLRDAIAEDLQHVPEQTRAEHRVLIDQFSQLAAREHEELTRLVSDIADFALADAEQAVETEPCRRLDGAEALGPSLKAHATLQQDDHRAVGLTPAQPFVRAQSLSASHVHHPREFAVVHEAQHRKLAHGRHAHAKLRAVLAARLVLTDLDDDDRDVVAAAAAVRVVDAALWDRGGVGVGQDALRRYLRRRGGIVGSQWVGEIVVQPVGAEQEAILGEHVEVLGVDIDGLVDPDRSRDRILDRQIGDLFLGQPSAAQQLVDERVILGELMDLIVPREVDPAVADVRDEPASASEKQGAQRGAHPFLGGVVGGHLVDACACVAHSELQECEHVLAMAGRGRGENVAQHAGRRRARHLTGRMTAHAVAHDEEAERLVDEEVVLVDLTDLPGIRGGPEADVHARSTRRFVEGHSGMAG